MITFGNLQADFKLLESYTDQVCRVFWEIQAFVFTYHSPCSTYSIALLEGVWDSHGFPIFMTWVSWVCLVNILYPMYFGCVKLEMHPILLSIHLYSWWQSTIHNVCEALMLWYLNLIMWTFFKDLHIISCLLLLSVCERCISWAHWHSYTTPSCGSS